VLEVKNDTHALWRWHRNQDLNADVAADEVYIVREPGASGMAWESSVFRIWRGSPTSTPNEKAASELPSRRRSRVQGPGALLSRRWWSASPSAGHGNGERVRPELRSAMAARR